MSDAASAGGKPGVLLELATLIAERQSLGSVFRAFAKRLLGGTDFNLATLIRWNPATRMFETIASFPDVTKEPGALTEFTEAEVRPWALKRAVQGLPYEPTNAGTRAGEHLTQFGMRHAWSIALLGSEGEVAAILTVARTAPSPFSAEEQEFLRTAAQLLTSAVREESRVDEARAEAERSRLLNELSLVLNEQQPVAELFDRVATVLMEGAYCEFALLAFAVRGGEIEAVRTAPVMTPLEHRVFEQQARKLVDVDASFRGAEASEGMKHALEGRGMGAHLSIPLHEKGEVLGALVVAMRDPKGWNSSGRRFLDLTGRLLSQALAWERRYSDSLNEAETQRVLASIMSAAAREPEPGPLLSAIQAELSPIVPLPVLLFGFEEGRTVSYVLADGETVERSFRIETDQEVFRRLPAELRGARRIRALGMTNLSVSTARAGGSTIGYLVIGTAAEGAVFSDRQLRLFQLVAQLIGPVLQQAREQSAELRERALLQLALGSLTEGIVLFDKDLRPAYHNTLGGRLLDLAAEGAVEPGEPGPRLPREIAIQQRTTAVYGAATDGRSRVTIDGDERWIDYTFVPLDHPDYRLMWVVRDATEEVELEERKELHREEMERAARLAALGSIVGGVAHELNNPLTAILGFSELLVSTTPEGPLHEDLKVIHKEAERAKRIVSDLQLVGKQGTVDRSEFSIGAVIGHIERVRQPEWRRNGISVRFEVDGADLRAWGNEDRITQVLLNLVTNAEDAVAGRKDAAIVVSAYENGGMAVIEVWDNGGGMDAATKRRIFEPFFTTKPGTGTGLGLSVSYSIVAAHDGVIEVESTPGGGSCFRVRLPVEGESGRPEPGAADRKVATAMRVLLIDDEPNVRKIGQRLVQSLGHECSVADGPSTAAALVASDSFDVVLCDYRLGSASADDVIAAFEETNPAMVSRTVLATGAMNDDGVQSLLRRHNLKLLPKPYGAEELDDLLRSFAPVG